MAAPASSTLARDPLERSAEQPAHVFALEPGRVIAKKYVLERPAGFGGMAQLWVATNQATGAEVCVKLLVPDPETPEASESGGRDGEVVERFRREAHAAAKLSHRAIVRVFDLLELDERGEALRPSEERAPYAHAIVMELLRGETLGDMLAKRGKLPLEEALDLFLPIASALGYAHRADVIHRDLKPDNIFLASEPDGHVIPKVLDFGVSKVMSASAITFDGVLVGTPCFMSPEQARGARNIDARSDVFSAGILLYMMLSGRNPFEAAPTFAAVVDAVLRREVPPLDDVPAPIWAVIERAIAKDPAARFSAATEMAIALRKAAGRRATTESDPMIPVPAPASSRRPPASSGALSRAHAELPSSELVPASTASDTARHRRAIVAAVLGMSVVLILAAGLVTAFGAKAGTVPTSSTPATSLSVATSTDVSPPASGLGVVASAGLAASEPPPPAPRAAPARVKKAVIAPAGASAAPLHGKGGATSPPVRRPGSEPNKARDPGF